MTLNKTNKKLVDVQFLTDYRKLFQDILSIFSSGTVSHIFGPRYAVFSILGQTLFKTKAQNLSYNANYNDNLPLLQKQLIINN